MRVSGIHIKTQCRAMMATRINLWKIRRIYDRYREDREFWWNTREQGNLCKIFSLCKIVKLDMQQNEQIVERSSDTRQTSYRWVEVVGWSTSTLLISPPLSTGILCSLQFCSQRETKWWRPVEFNDRNLRSHGKIGDWEHSTEEKLWDNYDIQHAAGLANSSRRHNIKYK